MNKKEIINLLEENIKIYLINKHNLKKSGLLLLKTNGQPGQHVAHLVDAMQRVNKALNYLKFLFGKANRAVRECNEVVNRHQPKLAKN